MDLEELRMRPEFETFKLVTDGGGTVNLPVNVNAVISVVDISIPGKLKNTDGSPISKRGAGLDIGFRIIPVACSSEEAIAMLEGKKKGTIVDAC